MIGICAQEEERNCLLFSRVYVIRYPHGRHPDEKMFGLLLKRFIESGNVAHKKEGTIKFVSIELKKADVLLTVVENPNLTQKYLVRSENKTHNILIAFL